MGSQDTRDESEPDHTQKGMLKNDLTSSYKQRGGGGDVLAIPDINKTVFSKGLSCGEEVREKRIPESHQKCLRKPQGRDRMLTYMSELIQDNKKTTGS